MGRNWLGPFTHARAQPSPPLNPASLLFLPSDLNPTVHTRTRRWFDSEPLDGNPTARDPSSFPSPSSSRGRAIHAIKGCARAPLPRESLPLSTHVYSRLSRLSMPHPMRSPFPFFVHDLTGTAACHKRRRRRCARSPPLLHSDPYIREPREALLSPTPSPRSPLLFSPLIA